MLYEFSFSMDENDYYEFNKTYMRNAFGEKDLNFFMKWLVPAVLAIRFFFNLATDNFYDSMSIIASFFVLFLGSFLWLHFRKYLAMFFIWLTVQLSVYFTKMNGKLPFSRENRLQFHDDHIHEQTETTETKFDYSCLEKIFEDNNAIYIFFNSIQAFMIPLSAFESEGQKKDFLVYINEKANKGVSENGI